MVPRFSTILLWDAHPENAAALIQALREASRNVEIAHTFDEVKSRIQAKGESQNAVQLIVADLETLLTLGESQILTWLGSSPRPPLAIATDMDPEHYLGHLRRLRLHHLIVKSGPFFPEEFGLLLDCAISPIRGFGLLSHFAQTLEMYSLTFATRDEKSDAIERVINHFATVGFVIHELYDVRLILEEITNNALFHAFRNPDGSEKYNMSTFQGLDSGETVRIDYGHAMNVVGFAVTDNAGTLDPDMILYKLERQYNREGLFDLGGRGLYLSRLLASTFFFNIEKGLRTQIVASFREKDSRKRPKPITINALQARTYRAPSLAGRAMLFAGQRAAPLPEEHVDTSPGEKCAAAAEECAGISPGQRREKATAAASSDPPPLPAPSNLLSSAPAQPDSPNRQKPHNGAADTSSFPAPRTRRDLHEDLD